MNFRPAFWPGVLLGALAAFAALFRKSIPAPPAARHRLLDFVSEAVLACDAAGQVTEINAAACALFGPDLAGYQSLCYPTGQPVPPGQRPPARRDFSPSFSRFLLTDTRGQTRTLEVTVRSLPGGGAAAVFRDVTAHAIAEAKDVQADADADTLHTLCRHLSRAGTVDDIAGVAVEAALAFGAASAQCFTFDADAKQLTLAAARPDTRPRRPRTQQAARPVVAAFDATDRKHWAVYVAGEPFESAKMLALPLLAGGSAEGHLELQAVPQEKREALTLAASLTAAALAARREADRAEQGARREAALGEVARLVASAAPFEAVCDAAAAHARHLLAADICTVTLDGRLRGQDYHDGLLRPERHTAKDPALQHEAAGLAMASGQTVQRVALRSPDFAAGVWRAFAGASGSHRVLAVPLTGRNQPGALTVWAAGEGGFSAEQVTFAETLAALLSAHRATKTASRAKP